MKLSDAIRLGAMLKPQAFGDLQFDGGTCALGAAYDAAGFLQRDSNEELEQAIVMMFPILNTPQRRCPVCGEFPRHARPVFATNVAHLNDDHRWTREQIADWVATIQPPETPPATERTSDEIIAVDPADASAPQAVYARKGI